MRDARHEEDEKAGDPGGDGEEEVDHDSASFTALASGPRPEA
jgi:hypothetical protein